MKKMQRGFIVPSAAITIPRRRIRFFRSLRRAPRMGDLAYGMIVRIGQHSSLENAFGRIHTIYDGSRAVLVFGNRYAPDYYEGLVPEHPISEVDLLARSGLIGTMVAKNAKIKDPTRVKLFGYVCDESGKVLNTTAFPLAVPRTLKKRSPRARMILVCGTSMNSGKSVAAAACCWALSSLGYRVRAAKVTGTASLKDILNMNDAGAHPYADFSYLGYPSTYMLPEHEVISIFNQLDLKYANNPKNYWVVEFADGINQRETAMLLSSKDVTSRIDRLILCATDTFAAVGGLRVLKEQFGLVPDALSGLCSGSPLYIRELRQFSGIPVFRSAEPDLKQLGSIILHANAHPVLDPAASDFVYEAVSTVEGTII